METTNKVVDLVYFLNTQGNAANLAFRVRLVYHTFFRKETRKNGVKTYKKAVDNPQLQTSIFKITIAILTVLFKVICLYVSSIDNAIKHKNQRIYLLYP